MAQVRPFYIIPLILVPCSLQSRRNFDEQVLSIYEYIYIYTKIKLGREKKFVTRGRSTVKNMERVGGGEMKIAPIRSHC